MVSVSAMEMSLMISLAAGVIALRGVRSVSHMELGTRPPSVLTSPRSNGSRESSRKDTHARKRQTMWSWNPRENHQAIYIHSSTCDGSSYQISAGFGLEPIAIGGRRLAIIGPAQAHATENLRHQ